MRYVRFTSRPSIGPNAAGPPSRNAQSQLGRAVVFALGLWLAGFASGCAAVPVNVGNPIPGMTTIAVAPFFNLSAEPSVDGRRFAIAYYTELSKTANYQVIPVGIVETAIRENDLDMSNSADAVKLAQILDADAVVIGAVTHYSPYYPPQLGVHIRWFSPREWVFYPGISGGGDKDQDPLPDPECLPPEGKKPATQVVRGQSADRGAEAESRAPFPSIPHVQIAQSGGSAGNSKSNVPPGPVIWPSRPESSDVWPASPAQALPGKSSGAFCEPTQSDAVQPVMSYTRFFDGADQQLIQALEGYYVMRGDMRSGGWEAYLHRSDDFVQFASHVLVVEMLMLHGGPLKTKKMLLFGR